MVNCTLNAFCIFLTDVQKAAFTVSNPSTEHSGTVVFTNVVTNIGGQFNTTTGQFRCKVPGIYNFLFHMRKKDEPTCVHCYIQKNKNKLIDVHVHPNTAVSDSFSGSGVFYLNNGDIVDIGGCSYNHLRSDSYFTGFLVAAT